MVDLRKYNFRNFYLVEILDSPFGQEFLGWTSTLKNIEKVLSKEELEEVKKARDELVALLTEIEVISPEKPIADVKFANEQQYAHLKELMTSVGVQHYDGNHGLAIITDNEGAPGFKLKNCFVYKKAA